MEFPKIGRATLDTTHQRTLMLRARGSECAEGVEGAEVAVAERLDGDERRGEGGECDERAQVSSSAGGQTGAYTPPEAATKDGPHAAKATLDTRLFKKTAEHGIAQSEVYRITAVQRCQRSLTSGMTRTSKASLGLNGRRAQTGF
eukprot:6182890-Pleurochrysis_carterae.AAC.2